MNREEILNKLQKTTEETLGLNGVSFTPKTKLSGLAISSYGIVQLICAVEDAFDIEIANKDLKACKTVGDVVKIVEKGLSE
ncbi:MAG: acyl carrier protein [Clostridia bacterium]|nr:acyl carrier protein [Clostridia bacterium]